MLKIQTKTFSLRYHPKEDRMKLVINQNEENPIVFWITRRLYLSFLFDVDTYLESIGMEKEISSSQKKDKEHNSGKEKERAQLNSKLRNHLLNKVKLNIGEKRKRFFISFHADSIECETVITKAIFLEFYMMMKNTFPKKEWGII